MTAGRRALFHVLAALALAGPSIAAPVQWAGNGHYYEVIPSTEISWQNAYTAATTSAHLGNPGYLATVTSSGEQAFVQALLGGGFQYWIGGYQAAAGAEPGGGWTWDTAEAWGSYTNWDTLQPDDNGIGSPGGEDFLAMFSVADHPTGSWNDEDNPGCPVHGPIAGYIVEYAGVTGVLVSPLGSCPALVQCNDGLDNDNDGCVDYPQDSGCSSASDNDETGGGCSSPVPAPGTGTPGLVLLALCLSGTGIVFLRGRFRSQSS